MTPMDCYRTYLAMKSHFNDPKYDYFKYAGKTKLSSAAYNKRKDRYFFERMSRKRSDKEILDFFLASFVECNDPQKLWIGEIIHSGEEYYNAWKRRIESLTYNFKEELNILFEERNLNEIFKCKSGNHSYLLKQHMINKVSLETMVILDMILQYSKRYDSLLIDPIWESYSMKIRKYQPFLKFDIKPFKRILKEKIEHE